MTLEFVRSLAFDIPGTPTSPGVKVFVTERDGKLVFELNVQATSSLTADLRGLFFNTNSPLLLDALGVAGVHVSDFDTVKVIDLGNGANLHGAAKAFDVGVEFGTQGIGSDDLQFASFTLAHPSKALTLDDFANVQFGARLTSIGAPGGMREGSSKLTVFAPAAPDARADSYTVFEDGAAGLDSPTHAPKGVLFQVLANDTDADGNVLSVTALRGVSHGTVRIVDGNDADTLAGDAVMYTPDADYAGADGFDYLISDGNGGTDFAHVSVAITAVADAPTLSYQLLTGATFNQVVVRVTATQTDLDSSEFIDRIDLSGIPAGVEVAASSFNPDTQPGQIVRDFVLTLPEDQDSDFALGITATSKEASNGDVQTTSVSAEIAYAHTLTLTTATFEADDQSMWSNGAAYKLSDSRFFGVEGHIAKSTGSVITANLDLHYKLGLQSDLSVSGGTVDATVPYTVSVETSFNKATGWLHFDTSAAAMLGNSVFSTKSPTVTYHAALVANVTGSAGMGIAFEVPGIPGFTIPGIDFGELGSTPDIEVPGIPGVNVKQDFSVRMPGNNSVPLIDFDGQSVSVFGMNSYKEGTLSLTDFLSAKLTVPTYGGSSEVVGDHLESSDSDDFLTLTLDVDDLVAKALSLDPSPFHQEAGVEGGLFYLSNDVMNYSLHGDIGIGQDFAMSFAALQGLLLLEDGFSRAFTFGDDLDFLDAHKHDLNGDGIIAYTMTLDPDAQFSNDLFLTLGLGQDFSLFKLEGAIEVAWLQFKESFSLGPVYDPTLPGFETDIKLVGFDFDFDLGTKTLVLAA